MKLCQRFRRSTTHQELTNEPFKLYPREPYIFFGWGTLGATEFYDPQPVHYFRLRPFIGRADPCLLQNGLRRRHVLTQSILRAEKRELSRALWQSLFIIPPSHVLRFGWRSSKTGHCHDILYLPLCFRYPGFGARGLAKDFGGYLLNAIEHSDDLSRLCPSSRELLPAQISWLTIPFIHYEWQVLRQF